MTSPQEPPSWTSPGGQDPQGAQPGEWGAPEQPPSWSAPQGQPAPVPPPPGYGQPQQPPGQWGRPPAAPPAWGQPVGYGPVPGYGAPANGQPWRPPALQPGIVPLRPLSLGEILDGGVRAIRANPAVMFGLSAVVVTVATLISLLLMYYLSGVLAGSFGDLTAELDAELGQAAAGELDSAASLGVATLISQPVTTIATTILTGLLVVSVSRSVLGRKIPVREVLRSRRVWWVVGFSLLASLGVALVAGAWIALVVWFAVQDMVGGAVAVGIVGGLGLLVGAAWFTVRTLLVTPALMLEGKPFWQTVARAWRLTRRSFWRLLGTYLLVLVMMYLLGQIVVLPFSIVGMVFAGGGELVSFGYLATLSVGQVIASTATVTYTSAVVALLYVDVRMRREGLDVELGRAAAADAAAAVR